MPGGMEKLPLPGSNTQLPGLRKARLHRCRAHQTPRRPDDTLANVLLLKQKSFVSTKLLHKYLMVIKIHNEMT